MRSTPILIVLVAVAITVGGCGASNSTPIIARVGTSVVTKPQLTRLIAAIAPEGVAPEPPHYIECVKHQEAGALAASDKAVFEQECERQYQTLKAQALSLLVAADWLTGQASDEGLKISGQEVAAQLGQASRAFGSGSTPADSATIALKARAELSARKIVGALGKRKAEITPAAIATYYHEHIRHFERRELRYVDLAENFESVSAARSVMAEFMSGARDISSDSLHEILERTDQAGAYSARKPALHALFAAKLHVLSGPILLNVAYSIFEVTRIVPAVHLSLASVKQSIANQLMREQQQRELAQFVAAMKAKWIARTACEPGYIVQKCRQYTGVRGSEDPLVLE
jgi:hypothetical protein